MFQEPLFVHVILLSDILLISKFSFRSRAINLASVSLSFYMKFSISYFMIKSAYFLSTFPVRYLLLNLLIKSTLS